MIPKFTKGALIFGLVALLVTMLIPWAAFAGSVGQIKGRLTDKGTGEGIIGASVAIANTKFGATTDVDRLRWRGREVRLGAFPMGIDAARFEALASGDEVLALAEGHRAGRARLVVGVDRLDYTKGIPQRLRAREGALEGVRLSV